MTGRSPLSGPGTAKIRTIPGPDLEPAAPKPMSPLVNGLPLLDHQEAKNLLGVSEARSRRGPWRSAKGDGLVRRLWEAWWSPVVAR